MIFHCVQFLDAARYEHFSVVLKRAYSRTSMSKAPKMRETASGLRPVVDRLKTKGMEWSYDKPVLGEGNRMQSLKKVGCLLRRYFLWINLHKLLKMNMNGFSRDLEHETAVAEALRGKLSRDQFISLLIL